MQADKEHGKASDDEARANGVELMWNRQCSQRTTQAVVEKGEHGEAQPRAKLSEFQ